MTKSSFEQGSKGKDIKNMHEQNQQFQQAPSFGINSSHKHIQELFMTQEQKNNYQLLIKSHRFYRKLTWTSRIKLSCVDCYYDVAEIEVHYGILATKIKVVNIGVSYKSQLEEGKIMGFGSFGRVEVCRYKNGIAAVKLIKIQQDDRQNLLSIEDIYREYFIALISSQLGIGPKICDIFGVEVVFLDNYGIFGMQICQSIQFSPDVNKSHISEMFLRIKKSLDILHSLHIVHRDIKPQNMLWSPHFHRQVFIDFGLSKIIDQNKGQKTYTPFAGSYSYCSPQMRKNLTLGNSSLVDLYENDQYSLSKVENYFLFSTPYKSSNSLQKLVNSGKRNTVTDNYFLEGLVQITNIKMNLFTKSFKKILSSLNNCQYTIKTCLYISNKIQQQYKLSLQDIKLLKQWKNLTKQKLTQQKNVIYNVDKMFFGYLQSTNFGQISSIIPTCWSLQNQLNNLQKWVNNQMWLSRIFFILYNGQTQKTYNEINNFPKVFYLIINKFYQYISGEDTKIFMKKIRRVLLFFSQKFLYAKNIKFLQILADLFDIIGDSTQMAKIRSSILINLEDPLVYCLKNLYFYVYDQKDYLFNLGRSIRYLLNIQRVVNQSFSKSHYLYYQLLTKVTQQFLTFPNDTDQKQMKILQQILFTLQRIAQTILKYSPGLVNIINWIKIRFQKLYINFVQDVYQYTHLNQEIRIQLIKKRSQLTGKIFGYTCQTYIPVFNLKRIYWEKCIDELQKFQKAKDYKLIKQYIQFYSQMNNLQEINRNFGLFFVKCHYVPSLIDFALKQKLKYIIQQQIQCVRSPSAQICQQIIDIQKYLIIIKIVSYENNKELQTQGLQKTIRNILVELKQKVRKFVQNQSQKSLLLLFIEILHQINFNHLDEEEQKTYFFRLCCLKIKQLTNKNNEVGYLVRTIYMQIIFTMLKTNLFKKKENINGLQDIIFEVSSIKNSYYEILLIQNFFPEYIRIVHKRYQYPGYNIMTDAILFFISRQEYFTVTPIVRNNLRSGIIYFVSFFTHFQANDFLLYLKLKDTQTFSILLHNYYGCYLLYCMLHKSHKSGNISPLANQLLFKIGQCLSKCWNFIRMEILKSYFQYFILINKKNPRKLLICQRLELRHNQTLKLKMKHSLGRIKKKLQNWPQKISLKIQKKLDIGFTST